MNNKLLVIIPIVVALVITVGILSYMMIDSPMMATSDNSMAKGHEVHQIVWALPYTGDKYVGSIDYSATASMQLVVLDMPVDKKEEGKKYWTETEGKHFPFVKLDDKKTSGTYDFDGYAVILHNPNPTSFDVEYYVTLN